MQCRQWWLRRAEGDISKIAGSLTNLSIHLSDLGRREEALEMIEEAVSIYRKLAADRPDAFRPDLALSLTNFSNHLSTWSAGGGTRGD